MAIVMHPIVDPSQAAAAATPVTPTGAAADGELTRRALAGDREARHELAERMRFVPRLLAVLNRRRGSRLDRHELEDLSQDTVALVWSRLDTFTGGSMLETWLYSYCVNMLANALRKRMSRSQFVPEPIGEDSPPPPPLHDDVHAAMERLTPHAAQVIRLRFFEEFSFPEIATRVRHPLPTVKAWFYRGMKRLAKELGDGRGRDAGGER
jgi:RNA polymerase sigma-70 factor (ECF subfamily)